MDYRINGLGSVVKTFKPGELVLFAGRPDSGMTALAAEMAEYLVSEEEQDLCL